MAEEKQVAEIRAAIEKTKGKTQAEKEINYFKDILQKLEKVIPAYLPDDKRIKGYTYSSDLPSLRHLVAAVYNAKLKSDEVDVFDEMRMKLIAFEIRSHNYKIENLKTQEIINLTEITALIARAEFFEHCIGRQLNKYLSSTDHLLIAKRYYDQFCAKPHTRSYGKCRKHLNAARLDKSTAGPADELLKKLLGLKTTSKLVEKFYIEMNATFETTNTSEDLVKFLKGLESEIPENRDLELYDSNDKIFDFETEQFSPGSLVNLLCSSKEEGGIGLCLWDQTITDKAYSLEARLLWIKFVVAGDKFKKNQEHAQVICNKYWFLLHEAISSVVNKTCLDPEILFYFSQHPSFITKEGRHAYVPHSWKGNLSRVTEILSGKKEPSDLDVGYPKLSNIGMFEEFWNSIFSQGQKLCTYLQEKKLEVKQLAGKIAELQKVDGIHLLDLRIFDQILALEVLIKGVLKTSKDPGDRTQLREFIKNCRGLREEIVSIRNTYIFHDPKSDEQVQNKQVKNELQNRGAGLKTVTWITQQNFQSVLGVWGNSHAKPQASSTVSSSSSSSNGSEKESERKDNRDNKHTAPQESNLSNKQDISPKPLTKLGELIQSGNLAEIKKTPTFSLKEPVDGIFPPLIYAVVRGEVDIISYFLERGADINAKDAKNKTALERAVEVLLARPDLGGQAHFLTVLDVLLDNLWGGVVSEKLDLNGLKNLLGQLQELTIKVSKLGYSLSSVQDLIKEIQEKLGDQREAKSVSSDNNFIDALKAKVASGELDLDSLKELHNYLGREMQAKEKLEQQKESKASAPLSAPPQFTQLIRPPIVVGQGMPEVRPGETQPQSESQSSVVPE